MKENTFYKDKTFEYPEMAVLMEGNITKDNPIGKFVIPILTPNFNNDRLMITEKPKLNNSNIINKQTNKVTTVTEQNYVTLEIPQYMFTNNIQYKKGDKFIVVFIGGDVNKIRIIGVY